MLTLARSTANPITDSRKSVEVLHVSRSGSIAGIANEVPRLELYELFRDFSLLHVLRMGTESDATRQGAAGGHRIASLSSELLLVNSQNGLLLVDFLTSQLGSRTKLEADIVDACG